MSSNSIDYFSNLLSKSFIWHCELCWKPVMYSKTKQNGRSCLCVKCMITELRMEQKVNEACTKHD